MDQLVEQFCTVTGVDDVEIAKNYLEACNGNIEIAISMHMDNSDSTQSNKATSSTSHAEDTVRAPIPQKQEVLVEHDCYLAANQRKRKRSTNPNSVFDKFRDFQAEARQQENMMRNGGAASQPTSAHLLRLEDLFRPPLDIIHHGTLTSAQAKGKIENKWVLVNIQNTSEFSCQVLNRDIWKDPSIRELIIKHFILWQVYHDSVEGQKFIQFYPVTTWPYIAILHPVTAELLKQWNSIKLRAFEKDLQEFVLLHSKPDGTEASLLASSTNSPAKMVDPALDASEESQIEAAIQASLNDSKGKETQVLEFESDSDEEVDTFTDSDEESNSKGKQLLSGVASKKSQHKKTESNNGVTATSETIPPKCAKLENTKWSDHVSEHGTDVNILFKKPDLSRCQWCVKSKSTIKALLLYVESLGFGSDKYEVIANFPRRNISDISSEKTFEDCGFQKQETFYIQKL